ncbi:uncharacterized protein LOC116130492 [Pistacia vera]|uniref:uncharacterized protein LOC116130492 n=1 Tax=Pistacia vera TaxID=55513 RepID=UPI001263A174|nr:uncharacterized protein LOC116130492 [Pistacia vera]
MASQAFSGKLIKLWGEYEVRMMILLSLSLQIILIIFGSQRKYRRSRWINILVWLAYLAADWVATVALGILARSQGLFNDDSSQPNNVIQAFWASFLLLHLGGPDTITAYSLEDNELWLRHLLGFVIQVGVAFYILVRCYWDNNEAFIFLAIPVFIIGVIKYGERTLVLRSSSAKQLKDSLLSSPPESGPEYDEIVAAIGRGEVLQTKESTAIVAVSNVESIKPKDYYLVEASMLFERLRCLFADLILSHYERKESYSLIHNKPPKDAFKLVAVELGFMYDVLFSKATTIYSRFGIFLRCFCFFSHVSVSIVFLYAVDKHAYSPIDISITCVLLLGAVFLDLYAFIVLLLSDWTKLWLTKHNFNCHGLLLNNSKRWSESMGQYNLLSLCLKDISSKTVRAPKLLGIKEILEKYQYLTWEDVNVDLQEMIFEKVRENGKKMEGDLFNIKLCKELLAQRGDYALGDCFNEFGWSTTGVEFDHSILLWHIATDLFHYLDHSVNADDNRIPISCKQLSDYMLYLLVICPTMLPKGIGEIRYRETCAEALRFFERKRKREKISNISRNEACQMLLQVNTDGSLVEDIKGDRSLSVLYYGCKLAKQLQNLKSRQYGWSHEQVWKMVSEVWIEMLTYAASHGGWKEHGQQLIKGGEWLSHVRLLMSHFGLSDQYQIQKGSVGTSQPPPPQARPWFRLAPQPPAPPL